MNFEHVLVVGAGQMGGGIAQVVAASGRRVALYDTVPGAVDRALGAMGRSLEKRAEKGGGDPSETLARVAPADGLVAADLMIEAVVEDAEVKTELFRKADQILPREAILASNTSSIPITTLAAATTRPDTKSAAIESPAGKPSAAATRPASTASVPAKSLPKWSAFARSASLR